MAKKKIAIGLDIGAHSVKMVCLERDKKDVRIIDYKIKEYMPEGGGVSARNEVIGDVRINIIKGVLKDAEYMLKQKYKAGIEEVPVIVSAEGSQVFIRVFKLPGVAKNKLNKIIAYEAQQQVPFPINEVVWSYQCLRKVTPEETDVVLSAIRNNIVNDFINSIGISISDVVPPVIGLNNLLSWAKDTGVNDPAGQPVMVLDLGAKTTNVIIFEKEYAWFRTISLGGESITQAIISGYSLDFSSADKIKREKGRIVLEGDPGQDSDERSMSSCIIKPLARLVSEITRSIEVYCSGFNSLGPVKIFITGGTSELGNIGDFLSKKFRVNIDNLEMRKYFSTEDNIDKDKLSKDIKYLSTALGLSLQGLDFGKDYARKGWVNLSLLPRQVLKKHKWLKQQAYLIAAAGLFVFLGICFSGYNTQMAQIYKANIAKLESEKKAMDINKKEILDTQKKLDIVTGRMDKINELNDARVFWMDMLLKLEEAIPENVWLTELGPVSKEEAGKKEEDLISDYEKYAKDAVDIRFKGKTTGTYEDVVAFRDALDNSGHFVKDTCAVVSASPPVSGVRDFIIDVKAKVTDDNK